MANIFFVIRQNSIVHLKSISSILKTLQLLFTWLHFNPLTGTYCMFIWDEHLSLLHLLKILSCLFVVSISEQDLRGSCGTQFKPRSRLCAVCVCLQSGCVNSQVNWTDTQTFPYLASLKIDWPQWLVIPSWSMKTHLCRVSVSLFLYSCTTTVDLLRKYTFSFCSFLGEMFMQFLSTYTVDWKILFSPTWDGKSWRCSCQSLNCMCHSCRAHFRSVAQDRRWPLQQHVWPECYLFPKRVMALAERTDKSDTSSWELLRHKDSTFCGVLCLEADNCNIFEQMHCFSKSKSLNVISIQN